MALGLWNVIRDFFVMYVFGGITSTGADYFGRVGTIYAGDDGSYAMDTYLGLPINGYDIGNEVNITWIGLGDWLSTTATIITLCLLLFVVFLAIKFLFKLVAGSFLKIGE